MLGLLYTVYRRVRLGVATMIWGASGFASELGRQVKGDLKNPDRVDMGLKWLSMYIYVKSLSTAWGVPEEQVLKSVCGQACLESGYKDRKESGMHM
jgi:hypothetical protein